MKKKRMQQLIRSLMPALVTGAVILGCAKEPALREIPERLELSPIATRSAEIPPEPSPSHKAVTSYIPEKAEPVVPLLQGTGPYKDGIYTGTGTGYGGQISVQVTVQDGQIIGIEVLSATGETSSFFSRASSVIDSIIAAQTWEVDVVSGATYSSNGIKAAVQNALTGETVATETPNVPTGNLEALVEVTFSEPEMVLEYARKRMYTAPFQSARVMSCG